VSQPPTRQPIFNIPAAVLALIVAMAAIQALRDWLPDRVDADLLARFAFVPGRLTYSVDPSRVLARLAGLDLASEAGRQTLGAARFFLGDGSLQPWTALTYALLHGGWTHFGLNAVWLLAFGTPVARRLGAGRFMAFMAVGAVAGAATHYAVDPASLQPLVGASAAVSACMGAALRFMFRTAPTVDAEGDPAPAGRPRLSLMAMVADRRASAFLVVWLLTNLVSGLWAVPLGLSDMPIAWQAHVGGLLFGLLALPLFDPRREPVIPPPEQDAMSSR
jgi:membrane associated rhomboid family serine protease